MPQPPQLLGSVAKPADAYSQPSPASPSQSLNPGGTGHCPPAPAPHTRAAPHLLAQLPQWLGSVAKPWLSYSQPSAASPSQLLKPAAHGPSTHAPPAQRADA